MAALDKGRDRVHRTGTVESDRGNDVANLLGLQVLEHLLHAARFELKDAARFPGGNELVGVGVVKRERFERKIRFALTDLEFCIVQNGQIAERKEIEFEQSEFCDRVHIELGHNRAVARGKRNVVADRAVGDHDPCRMD